MYIARRARGLGQTVEVSSDVLTAYIDPVTGQRIPLGTGPVQAPSKTVEWLNAHGWQVAVGAAAVVALFAFGSRR